MLRFTNRITTLLLLSAMAMVSACGFQLRGTASLPEGTEPVYLDGASGQLGIELRNLLNASGVKLSDSIKDANSQLLIKKRRSNKRAAALGEGARVIEYQLIESLSFELRSTNGEIIFNPSRLIERKIINNDPNKVASSSAEELLLRREMLQNLAAKITRQLRAFDTET
ncbi:MAG: LPS-assembly lipoprotein [Oceanicoccus sp.]|jgi:LPS-assembly lipoprotein